MLSPPTLTQVRDAEIFKSGCFPEGMRVLGPDQMLAVNRRIFFVAPGLNDVELRTRINQLLAQQKIIVEQFPELATGFELNNFHMLTYSACPWCVNKAAYAATQQAIAKLGLDAIEENEKFIQARNNYKDNGDEVAYEKAMMHYFYDFLRPVYQALRADGYKHSVLTA